MILDENLIQEADQQEIVLTDKEIFTKIWTSPRLVFRYIHRNSYSKFVPILLVLAGIRGAIDRSISNTSGNTLELWSVLAIAIIGGALLGWISYYIYAALISWTGKWIGGVGNTSSIVRVLAYALIPSVAALIIVFLQIGVFGKQLFQSSGLVSVDFSMEMFYYVTFLMSAALSIWSFVLMVFGISEVQKLSIGKAFLNLLIPVLVILIPIAIVAFILGDLFG